MDGKNNMNGIKTKLKKIFFKEIKFNNIKNFLKEKGNYVLCFLLSFVIITSIFIIKKVTPFGDNTLLDSDFFYQYDVMLAEMRDRFLSHSDMIYSFRSGLGLPLYRNFFNYIASPINLIALFVQRSKFMMSFSFIIGVKAIISACTMYYYLYKRFGNNDDAGGGNTFEEKDEGNKISKFFYIPLALLYAFSGYFSSYYINIMWLDGMMLLPILAGSIDDIVKERKWTKYCITLVIIIFTNYYIGYMICIFSCLYFIYSFIVNSTFWKKKQENEESSKTFKKRLIETIKMNFVSFVKAGIVFALVSILAALMCMVTIYLVKTSLDSLDATTTNEEVPTEFGYDMIVRDVLLANFNGARSNLYYSDEAHIPHISVGVLSIMLVGLFLFNRKISLKEKIISILFIGFYFAAFFVPQIDFVIHAFHEPNDYPFRYAFIYSFIFIMIASRTLKDIKNNSYLSLIFIFSVILTFLIMSGREEIAILNQEVFIMNVVFLALYTIGLMFGKFFKYNRIIIALFIITVPIELVLMYRNKWNISQDINGFINDYNMYKPIVEYINKNDNEKFYRMDKVNYLSLNDGCWNGYNGITIFSSMAYNILSEFQCALGIPGNNCDSYIYNDTSPLYNLLFDVKYVIDGFEHDSPEYYDEIPIGQETAYRFKYTNGIGFGVNENLLDLKFRDESPFEIQNSVVRLSSRN